MNDLGPIQQKSILKMGHSRPLFVYLCPFKQTLHFLQQINVKNLHSVSGAGIRTHNFQNMSLLPELLDTVLVLDIKWLIIQLVIGSFHLHSTEMKRRKRTCE